MLSKLIQSRVQDVAAHLYRSKNLRSQIATGELYFYIAYLAMSKYSPSSYLWWIFLLMLLNFSFLFVPMKDIVTECRMDKFDTLHDLLSYSWVYN